MYELITSVSDADSLFSITNPIVNITYKGNISVYCQITYRYGMKDWLEDFMLFEEQEAVIIEGALELWCMSLELKEELQ